jgi:Fe-S-cluster containining protein
VTDGPKITCDGCGLCCLLQSIPPFDWEEVDALCGVVKASYEARKAARDPAVDCEPCFWLDPETRRCEYYKHRPEICQDAIRPGDEYCQRYRERAELEGNRA